MHWITLSENAAVTFFLFFFLLHFHKAPPSSPSSPSSSPALLCRASCAFLLHWSWEWPIELMGLAPGIEENTESKWMRSSFRKMLTWLSKSRHKRKESLREGMKTDVVALVRESMGPSHGRTEWTTQTRLSETRRAPCWWILPDVAVPAVLTQPGVTRASASQSACRPSLPSCPHGDVGAGPTETETTQAF